MLLAASAARAQGSAPPFEAMTLRVEGLANVNRGTFHTFWKPGRGLAAALEAPFYAGHVEAGPSFQRYVPRPAADVPAFDAFLLHVGWGPRLPLPGPLDASAKARVGVLLMRFHVEGEAEGLSLENEITLGLQARLRYALGKRWRVSAGAIYQRLYTAKRIDLWHVSLGMSRRFQAPDWLKTLLR